ncbi:hypothetical protein CMI37_32320 [Candidatus Pacearchaeota archaeon]|nr:hypothetical protein [Candidatus Pacearchaeota archaeon]
MSSTRTMGIAVTDTGTTQVLPLGFEYHEPASGDDQGEKVWVYVYNDEASAAFAQGTVVMRDAATTTYDGVKSTAGVVPAYRILGVAQHAIAAGSYGFIQKKGIAEVLAGTGTIDVNESICADGSVAGTAMESSALSAAQEFSCDFGWATEDAAAAALATCMINCLG